MVSKVYGRYRYSNLGLCWSKLEYLAVGISRNDISNKDSGSSRLLLPSGGILSMSVSASGVFTDAVSEQTLRSKVHQSTFESYNIIVPDLGTYAGQFMIASLEYAGEYNGEVTYSITLESSGDITFTSA